MTTPVLGHLWASRLRRCVSSIPSAREHGSRHAPEHRSTGTRTERSAGRTAAPRPAPGPRLKRESSAAKVQAGSASPFLSRFHRGRGGAAPVPWPAPSWPRRGARTRGRVDRARGQRPPRAGARARSRGRSATPSLPERSELCQLDGLARRLCGRAMSEHVLRADVIARELSRAA